MERWLSFFIALRCILPIIERVQAFLLQEVRLVLMLVS